MVLFGFGKADDPPPPRTESFAVSETGLARTENQDRVFVDNSHLVYCVADGVGGAAEGARASEMVCRNLKMVLAASGDGFKARIHAVERAVNDANAAICQYAQDHGYSAMGSTAAILVLDREDPRHVAVCHIGDSRVYRIRRGMPELLTRDHRRTAGANSLTRAVGAAQEVETEWLEISSDTPARYILCTDGVHDVLSAPRLAALSAAGPLALVSDRISRDIVRRGAPDNFSFVIVSV